MFDALLQPGEFVVNRDGVGIIGTDALIAANKGMGNMGGTNIANIEVAINIRNEGQIDEGVIRNRVMPTVKQELKQASLRGEFIMSPRGLRDS